VDGKPLGEKNPKWLQDDYVKFLRFAQLKMDAVPEGIVGVITNHRWLDNPTFRGMRRSLMRSFNQIYVLDLHGYFKEQAPDGSADENVFDIKQGVAISIFVKRPDLERGIWRGDLWGKRIEKYRVTAEATLKSLELKPLDPVTPFYFFAHQDAVLRDEHQEGWPLPEIFPVNVLGFQTHRDAFAVSLTEGEMKRKLNEFVDATVSDEELKVRYGLKSSGTWSLEKARAAYREAATTAPQIVAYRPFDNRWSDFSSLIIQTRTALSCGQSRQSLSSCAPANRYCGVEARLRCYIACRELPGLKRDQIAELCVSDLDLQSRRAQAREPFLQVPHFPR
jgi:hypothetical protein